MFTLKFRKSASKYYPTVLKIVQTFDDHVFENDVHTIKLTVKELFEKWDYFNLLFWKVLEWGGSSFGYDDYNLLSRSDRTRMFYSLQSAHSMWIGLSEDYIKRLAPVYFDKSIEPKLRDLIFNEIDINRLLDLLLAEKKRDEFQKEYGGF